MEAMKHCLEARMMILFAGAMAQTLPSAHVSKKCVDKPKATAILNGVFGAQLDDAKLRELRQLLRNITFPDSNPTACDSITSELKAINDRLWLRTQEIVEALSETITELGEALVDRMVLVEQWGRPADTYEVVLTREMLERLRSVQAIPLLSV
jgi:hypothetical protein